MTHAGGATYTRGLRAYALLFAREPASSAFVLLLSTLGMLTDGVGLLMLVPLLGALTGEASDGSLAQRVLDLFKLVGLQPTLGVILGGFLVLMAARALIRLAKDWASTQLRNSLTDGLRNDVLAALMRAEWRWLSERKRSDQTDMLLTEIQKVNSGVIGALGLQATCAAIIAYLAVALAIEPFVTGVVTLIAGVLFAVFSGQRRKAVQLGLEQMNVNRNLYENALESVGAIKLAKILGTQDSHIRSFSQAVGALRANQLRFAILSGVSRELFQLGGVSLVAGYIYLGVSVWNLPVARLLVLVLIFARLAPMLTQAQQWLHMLLNSLPSLVEAQLVIRQAHDAAEPHSPEGAAPSIRLRSSLELRDLTIRYSDADRPALDRISLVIAAGSKVLIMGPSGAGKSTLADVLMGLLKPDEGVILIDGAAIEGSDRIMWRRSVSYVPQDVTIYNGTVRENLSRANPAAIDREIVQALKAASADFVFDLPDGLDTRLGDGAHGLSGGEKQRIALARGLLQKPDLLVLDEVTSALDEANEARIHEALGELSGVTVVILGHRTRFRNIADQVIELDRGHVTAIEKKQ